jgi:hypothetical protein
MLPVVLFSLISIPLICLVSLSLMVMISTGIWLGRLKHTKDKYENITWTNEPIKSLGVNFGYNKTQCDQLNYEEAN